MNKIVNLDKSYSKFFSTPLKRKAFTFSRLKKDIKRHNKNVSDAKLNNFLQNKLKSDGDYIRYNRNFYIHKSTKSYDQILDAMFDGDKGYISSGFSLGRRYGAFNQDLIKSSYIVNTALTSKSNIDYIKQLFKPLRDSIDIIFVDIPNKDDWNAYMILNAIKWIGMENLSSMDSFMKDNMISGRWFDDKFIDAVDRLDRSIDNDLFSDVVDKNLHFKFAWMRGNNG